METSTAINREHLISSPSPSVLTTWRSPSTSSLERFRTSASHQEHDQLIIIQQDLQTAREIQLAILLRLFHPSPNGIDFDIYASMIAAKEVGGDFYRLLYD
jgi:hypothetical protein